MVRQNSIRLVNVLTGYAANGNLLGYTDSVMGPWSFNYDSLNRLTGGEDGSGPYAGLQMSWSYDSFGNRTGESFAGSTGASLPASTTAQYNANNQVTGVSLAYDAAGNVAADNANQYLYDADGHVCAVLDRTYGDMTGYLYNAEGQRVAKGSLTAFSCDMTANGFALTRESVLGQGGEQLAELALDESGRMAWHHTNVYAEGALFASYDPNGLHFLVADWLGTRRAQTDYAGVLEQTCQSLPFGNGETCSPTPTAQLFTTYQRDTESGNDYAQARYYASSTGRFLSPDPSGISLADITNPQSWNLYSYALNNPLINLDPTGLDCVYMNDDNTDVESIDHNSNSDECAGAGGTWRDGWVGNGQVSVGDDGNVNIAPIGQACVVAALLGMVAQTEGTASLPNGGYGSFAGGGTITSAPADLSGLIGGNSSADWISNPEALSGHPNVMVHLPRRDGSYIATSAFGRYQIMARTAAGDNFTNFSPAGQDAAATTLMSQRNMIAPAMNGDLSTAISRGSNEWLSLPGNSYGQGGKSMAAAQAAYNQAMQSAPECQ